MNSLLRIRSPLAAAVLSFGSVLGTAAGQTIVDDFTSPSHWTSWGTDGTGSLEVGSGQMNYTTTNTADSFAAQYLTPLVLSYRQDWSLQVTAHLGEFALPSTGDFANLSLVLSPIGPAVENNRVTYGFEYGNWGDGLVRTVSVSETIGGTGVPTSLTTDSIGTGPLDPRDTVSLRFDYSAGTHTITAWFDPDGVDGGLFDWQLQSPDGLLPIGAGPNDLGLGDSDLLAIALVGSSNGIAVNPGDVSFSHLSVTGAVAVPEPATYAAFAGLLAGSVALYRRRRQRAGAVAAA